jgi:hypothetical protein
MRADGLSGCLDAVQIGNRARVLGGLSLNEQIEVRFQSCGFTDCMVPNIQQKPLWASISEEKVLQTGYTSGNLLLTCARYKPKWQPSRFRNNIQCPNR